MADLTLDFSVGDETWTFPASYRVCGRCEGSGTITNPSIGAITREEWDRDWGEDEQEGYLSGRYDVTCPDCGGKRVVPEADQARFTDADRAAWVDYQGSVRALEECLAAEAAERAYGA
jgi:hypothetical protein